MSIKEVQEVGQVIADENDVLKQKGNWIRTTFPALSNRNYQLYFSGQLVSLVGTWLQIVAQGWLVLQLTRSAFLIGLVTALSTLPTLLFTLLGGIIVDRYPKKHILLFTQTSSMVLAFFLGILTLSGAVDLYSIGVIAFLLGTVNAIDAPARQAFVAELVNKEELPSAIALNSGTFNAARLIGPGIAGFLIYYFGTGGAFIINGFTYLAVIAALLSMRLQAAGLRAKGKTIAAIGEGIGYAFSHPAIGMLLVLAAVLSVFGWSYSTLMPLIAEEVYGLQAAGLGHLYAASGAGSLLAAFMVGALSKKIPPVAFIVGGNLIFAFSMLLFSFNTQLAYAFILLFFCGFGLLAQAAMINTTIQKAVQPAYRGRVMSLYVLMFLGFTPLGNLQVGYFSDLFSIGLTLRVGAICVLVIGLVIYLKRSRIFRDNY